MTKCICLKYITLVTKLSAPWDEGKYVIRSVAVLKVTVCPPTVVVPGSVLTFLPSQTETGRVEGIRKERVEDRQGDGSEGRGSTTGV